MMKGILYQFTAVPWQHQSPGGWCFVSLPKDVSKEIREALKSEEQGWGRLKSTASIGETEWNTAIWFDTKADTYLLPLKADVRKKEKLSIGAEVKISVWV